MGFNQQEHINKFKHPEPSRSHNLETFLVVFSQNLGSNTKTQKQQLLNTLSSVGNVICFKNVVHKV